MTSFVCPECGARATTAGRCPTDDVPLAATDDPMLGTEVNRYRLARLLGRGGMGRVYLGVQPQIRSRVAIKILSEDCAESPELLERFFAEARAVNLIRHEHIIDVLDLDRLPSGRPFIVMEFIDGRTLRKVIEEGDPDIALVAGVLSETLLALHAAHAAGVIHRDLKPDNIMVSAAGHATVLDFGIAKLAGGKGVRTRTGLAIGTPEYMAPEQIRGEEIDARTDIYAAGVALFEALTGRRPFDATTEYQLMNAHLETPPPSLRAFRNVPPALEAVVARALAKHPDDRYPTAKAMAEALRDAVAGAAIGHLATQPDRPPHETAPTRVDRQQAETQPSRPRIAPPQARSRLPLVLVGGGLVAATVVVVIALRGKREDAATPRDAGVAVAVVAPADAMTTAVVDAAAAAPPAPVDARSELSADPIRDAGGPVARARPHVDAGVARTPPAVGHGDITVENGVARMPIHVDLAHVDARALFPQVFDLSRSLIRDVVMQSFFVGPVWPDGTGKILPAVGGELEYHLTSASTSQEPCAVLVKLDAQALVATVVPGACQLEALGMPKCTIKEIRTNAGWPAEAFVSVKWKHGRWEAIHLMGGGGFSSETRAFDDKCR